MRGIHTGHRRRGRAGGCRTLPSSECLHVSCDTSGWGGGDGGGWVKPVDRGLADEEAEDLAASIPAWIDPVPGSSGIPVLLVGKCLTAAAFLRHVPADVAAEIGDELEQFVPELGVAEAGDDGEVEADLEHGAADGAAARFAFQVLQSWHEEFGIVPAGGAGGARCVPA